MIEVIYMKNKKIIIGILLIILLLIIALTIIFLNKKEDNNKSNNTEAKEVIEKETISEDKQEELKEETTPPEEIIEEKKEEKKEEVKEEEKKEKAKPATIPEPKKEEKAIEPLTPSVTPPPIEYTCPSGYTLNGTKCIQTIDASLQCPEKTYEFSDGTTTGCINLSEGVPAEEETCPSNYGRLAMISLGQETTYNCFPLYEKVYTCESGYTLNNNKCTKTIDAIKKTQ